MMDVLGLLLCLAGLVIGLYAIVKMVLSLIRKTGECKKYLKVFGAGFVVFFVSLIILGNNAPVEKKVEKAVEKNVETAVPVAESQVISVTTTELLNEYAKDIKAANEKYKGKTLHVTGAIQDYKFSGDTVNFFIGTGDNVTVLATTTKDECTKKIGEKPAVGVNITLECNDIHGGDMEGKILVQLRKCNIIDYTGGKQPNNTESNVNTSANSDNPLANQVTGSVREIKARGQEYNNKVVVLGPINVGSNRISDKMLHAYGTNANGKADTDASFDIVYNDIRTVNKNSYELKDDDIIFVKGRFVSHDESNFGYDTVYAQEIIYVGKVK